MRLPHHAAILALSLVLLPAPAVAQKLKVYILAGQSNMQGHARTSTFDYIGDDPETAPLLAKMRQKNGEPTVCKDVWVSYLTGGRGGDGVGTGRLTAGFGARGNASEPSDKIGPEFTFGLRIAEATDGPVLLIKTAWGGKSLHTDFRPPSAGPYVFPEGHLERLADQGKDVDKIQAEKAAATGVFYRKMIDHVRSVLENPGEVVRGHDRRKGYELAGFVWFQGWNDMVDRGTYPKRDQPGGYDQYTECMAHFIRDVRRDLEAPDLPFVIGVMGVGGPIDSSAGTSRVHANFREAMAAPAAMREFRGNVAAVQTAPFWSEELEEISGRMDQVRNMARRLRNGAKGTPNEDKKMSKAEQEAWLAEYRAKTLKPDDERIWQRGASNAGYHYLGCAKTMAQIGVAFADAVLAMQRG